MAKFDLYQGFDVCLPGGSYPVVIGHKILADPNILRRYVLSEQVLIVTNETIAAHYLQYLSAAFADKQCDVVLLQDGEIFKNQQSLFQIYDVLVRRQHHRDTTLIALGGGVVGDITGFAASTFQRGVSLMQIPTTLLAQVDASIGGKTAINHPQAKNMIGSFYQPEAVIIDLDTLMTLSIREFRAGLAEIIKYGLLVGGQFLEQVYNVLQDGVADNQSMELASLISQSCQIKARYVQDDERERGQRALLNLGHTFAHALESYTHYTRWLHGEAVSIGLYCAALLSNRRLTINDQDLWFVDKLLSLAKLPRRIPSDIDLYALRALMSQDKKVKDNRLRFVLIESLGNCYIEDQVSEEDLYLSLLSAAEGD